MSYILWIDDIRDPSGHHYARKVQSYAYRNNLHVVWVKTSQEAIQYVQNNGLPVLMSLDHDLGILLNGVEDTTMYFLKWLAYEYTNLTSDNFPIWMIHSDNSPGRLNMDSFLASLKKSME
jgi:hypothetical protein